MPDVSADRSKDQADGETRRLQPVFRPLILSCSLVVLGIYLAIYIGYTSARFMPDLNWPKPGLAEAEPAPVSRRT